MEKTYSSGIRSLWFLSWFYYSLCRPWVKYFLSLSLRSSISNEEEVNNLEGPFSLKALLDFKWDIEILAQPNTNKPCKGSLVRVTHTCLCLLWTPGSRLQESFGNHLDMAWLCHSVWREIFSSDLAKTWTCYGEGAHVHSRMRTGYQRVCEEQISPHQGFKRRDVGLG